LCEEFAGFGFEEFIEIPIYLPRTQDINRADNYNSLYLATI